MALEEFEEKDEQLSGRHQGYVRMRTTMDMGMGILWLGMGLFLAFTKYFSDDWAERLNDPSMKIFGGLCIVYGLFRIYRGIKKNYLKER